MCWVGGGDIHQHDNIVPGLYQVSVFLSIHQSIFSSTILYNYPTCLFLFLLLPSHKLALSKPMYPMLSTMRIPGLRRPVFLVLVASAVAALSLLFWSRQYVAITSSSSSGQRLHVSGLRGKECLTRKFAPSFSTTVHGEYHHSMIHRFH